jgi:hypothetical protein
MYTGVDKGYIGMMSFLYNRGDAEITLLAAEEATTEQF